MQNQTIDISEITDLTVLKSMAYDQIAARENAERSLKVVNERIAQIMNGSDAPKLPPTSDELNAAKPSEPAAAPDAE